MTKQAFITQDQLKQIAPFMSDEQTRFYICSVYFDAEGLLVATDGHVLGVVKAPSIKGTQCAGLMLGASVVNQALKAKPRRGEAVVYSWDGETLRAHSIPSAMAEAVRVGGVKNIEGAEMLAIPAKPHDGTFPSWRRVIPALPKTPLGSAAIRFNVDYAKRFKSVNSRTDAICIHPTDAECAQAMIVTNGNPDFFGVLMPMHNRTSYEETQKLTASLRGDKPETEAQAA